MEHTPREQRLAETFTELADTLGEDFELAVFSRLLADRCVDLLNVSAVGLLLADDRGKLQTTGAPGGLTWPADLLALQHEEGPCLDCFRSGSPVTAVDLRAAVARWPRFAPLSRAAGFRVAHALPLRLRTDVVGSLAFFLAESDAFPPSAAGIAQALADAAAISVVQHRTITRCRQLTGQLQNALTSRVLVEQAKGMLAERWGTSTDDAFDSLRRYARSHNARLTEVARSVVERSADTDSMRPPGATGRP